MTDWIDVCEVEDIDCEDVMRFDAGGQTYAIYRATDGSFHATDGMCTHEGVHLSGGLVMDDIIECPKIQRAFQLSHRGCHPHPGLYQPALSCRSGQ